MLEVQKRILLIILGVVACRTCTHSGSQRTMRQNAMRSVTFVITTIVGLSVLIVGIGGLLLRIGVRGRVVAVVIALATFCMVLALPWLLGAGAFPVWIVALAGLAAGVTYVRIRRMWEVMQSVWARYNLHW